MMPARNGQQYRRAGGADGAAWPGGLAGRAYRNAARRLRDVSAWRYPTAIQNAAIAGDDGEPILLPLAGERGCLKCDDATGHRC